MSLPPALSNAVIPPEVLEVVRALGEKGFKAYLVGGCVRDLLRGKEPKDFDIATSARPTEVQRVFKKVIPTGIEHGTVTVLMKGRPIEVTTFRVESEYLDGRRPSRVEFHSEISADLSRRDFTINAMAFNPIDGELCDPFGGQLDLASRTIRCVGGPHARFSEDGLRPLRAVRFAAMLGFSLDPLTEAAIPDTLEVFRKVAHERIREELARLLTSPQPDLGLALLRSTGLLQDIAPELGSYPAEGWANAVEAVRLLPAKLELRLAALFAAAPVAASRDRLRDLTFPNTTVDKVGALLPHLDAAGFPTATDPEVRRKLAAIGREHAPDALDVAEARWVSGGAAREAFQPLRARYEAVLAQHPPLTARELALKGDAIMRILDVKPSRIVGDATRFLVERVLEDPALNTPERLEAELRKWASEKRS